MVAWWVLAGCRPAIVTAGMVQPTVYAYTEHQRFGALPERTVAVTEIYARAMDAAPPDGFSGVVYESIRSEDGREAGPRNRIVVGPEGTARFATWRHSGEWTPHSPKVELPAKVRPGDTWSGQHDGDHVRSCIAEVTPFCEGGIATACTSAWPTRTIWLRQHWCPGPGWVAFEAVASAKGQPETVFYSSGVTRDGQPVPAVDISRRPVPATLGSD